MELNSVIMELFGYLKSTHNRLIKDPTSFTSFVDTVKDALAVVGDAGIFNFSFFKTNVWKFLENPP